MKKILSLTTKHWMTGIAPAAHLEKGGIFHEATGVIPFKTPTPGSAQVGLLMASPTATDLTASTVVDVPIAGVVTTKSGGTTPFLFILGNAGHFYEIDVSTNSTPTDRRSASPITNPANGIAVFQINGGTKYLYYWRTTKIGRWDLTAGTGGFDDEYVGSSGSGFTVALQDTVFHPTRNFFDRVYYGNKDRIGMLYDNAGSVGHSANVLDFPTDYTCTCLEDDGQFLVIGITKNLNSGNALSETKVLFWDTNSSSWQREWIIPETSSLIALKKVGSFIQAITPNGLYLFNYSTPPQKVLPLAAADTSGMQSTAAYNIADAYSNAVIWGGSTKVSSFGKIIPDSPNARFEIVSGLTGTVSFVCSTAQVNNIFIGTTSNKLYRFSWLDNGRTDVSAETVYIPLGNRHQVGRVDVILGDVLGSGDSINIDLQSDESTTATDFGDITFADRGAVRRAKLTSSLETECLKVIVNFTGGNVKIKTIDVWGIELTS